MRKEQKLYQTTRGRLTLAIPPEAVKEFDLTKESTVEIDTDKKRGIIMIYVENNKKKEGF